MTTRFDLIVIGAGPGGYGAAIRASQLGLKTAVVEKDEVGGVCLNWGCIPSKNLIHQAELFHSLCELEGIGVGVDRSTLDYGKAQARSREVVATLTGGVTGLLKKNKITLIAGTASLSSANSVVVNDTERYEASHILIATGSRPLEVPGFSFDECKVLSSTGILTLTELPSSLIILGGGAIGCEFAFVMNAFGVSVTLVESMDHLLPTEEQEAAVMLESCFRRSGITVLTQTRAVSLTKGDESVTVKLADREGEREHTADKALVVFGRRPNSEDLGLQKLGVQLSAQGHVLVGDYNQTHVKGIYAIGDLTETPALAHVASAEGELAVERMAGLTMHRKRVDATKVPSAIYCEPQVAGFGLRSQDKSSRSIKTSVFRYSGAGKSIAVGKPDGFVKILCDEQTDEILGAHIIGHNATELIHELLLAANAELIPEDLTHTIHAHPTLSEAILESARGVNGHPIHA